MSDVFISYKSERKRAAEHFAEVLRRYGYSVWYDYSLLKGQDFAEQIDRQIQAAKALVVLWCAMSVGSRWVREEVFLAQKLGILIPVKIEACDPPLGFRLDDTIDLTGWDGNPRSHQLDALIDDIERKVGREAVADRRALIEFESHWRRYGAQPLRAFALGQPIEPENGGLPSLRTSKHTSQPLQTVIFPPMPASDLGKTFPLWQKAASHAEQRQTAIQYEDKSAGLVRSFTGHSGAVNSVAFSPDGLVALSGSADTTIKLWNANNGEEINFFVGHTYQVMSVAFSPDGRLILSGGRDRTLKLWDIRTEKLRRNFTGHSDAIFSVAFSNDCRTLLSGGGDKSLKLWDVKTGKELHSFAGHLQYVGSVAFSPSGKLALSGSGDATLRLWDLSAREELRNFKGHSEPVFSVTFSRDARLLISGGADRTIRLWAAETGEELGGLTGHSDSVTSIAVSPDGKCALSGSADKTIKLWSLTNGQELRTFIGHAGRVNSVVFSPDGRSALSGSSDRTLKLWDVSEWTSAR